VTDRTPVAGPRRGVAGARAVVTGGVHGIGAAVVELLTDRGADVVILDIDPGSGEDEVVAVDLADPDAVLVAASSALERLGGVDLLVNCAGVPYVADLQHIDLQRYHRTLAVNLHAAVLLMRELCPAMTARGYGRVVNVTSVHSKLSEPGTLTYDASKAALEAATRTAAVDLARSGVLVNAVAPGFVATRMSVVDGVDELDSDWFRTVYVEHGQLPLGRAAAPREIAEAVLWLGSAENTYVTGQVLVVDGGLSARM
jgi:NAD(P)-dependent dehydrogenase (short-subunit alcohol dehydrogenase family)